MDQVEILSNQLRELEDAYAEKLKDIRYYENVRNK